jgi:CRP/FNR family transcriptional regulator, cyclic AMP receptor protein
MGLADSPYKVMIRPCIPFLERVSEAEGERLVAGSRQVRHPAASVAFHRGDDMQVAILAAGLARVFISTTSGREATVRYVHKGELLGATLVDDEPFPASVQIVSEAVLQYLDRDRFRALAEEELEVARALAAELAARYIHAIQAATILVFGTPIQKVAYDLLDRVCRAQLSSGRLVAEVSHQELADSVNSSREVVSRALAELRRKRVVASAVRLTRVLDPERLAHIAWDGVI